jgi:hypothetical protein
LVAGADSPAKCVPAPPVSHNSCNPEAEVKAWSRRKSIAAQGRIDPALAANHGSVFSASVIRRGIAGEQFVHEPFEVGNALLQRVVLRLQVLDAWMVSNGSLL